MDKTLIDQATAARFRRDLDALVGPDERVGIAVSGGPDSLALLMLASAARQSVQAATVDHGLQTGSSTIASDVSEVCERLGVFCAILPVHVVPGASMQAQAREARYSALEIWATASGCDVVLTAHHADDQAETFLMRAARGAGLGGLTGIRARRRLSDAVVLARPLLAWRKAELEAIVQQAGLACVDDPANDDPNHDRTHVRRLLAREAWLDSVRVANSVSHLGDAEAALEWAVERLAAERIRGSNDLTLDILDLPAEFKRRLLVHAIRTLGADTPRGPDLARLIDALGRGESRTLGGLKFASSGGGWRVSRAPARSA